MRRKVSFAMGIRPSAVKSEEAEPRWMTSLSDGPKINTATIRRLRAPTANLKDTRPSLQWEILAEISTPMTTRDATMERKPALDKHTLIAKKIPAAKTTNRVAPHSPLLTSCFVPLTNNVTADINAKGKINSKMLE